MRGKTKNFAENTSVIIVFLILIISVYMFISPDANTEITKKTIEPIQVTKLVIKKNNIEKNKKIVKIVKIKPEPTTKPIIIDIVVAKEIITKPVHKLIPKPIPKPILKPIEKETNTFDKIPIINTFLRTTKNSINQKVKLFLDKNTIPINKTVNIRLTVLKDGNFEHLKYMGGDKQYFDLIKEEIKKVFPLYIDIRIDDQFPRYFRMTVKAGDTKVI